jgi:ATP-dependent Clp protease adapter protein ClpS
MTITKSKKVEGTHTQNEAQAEPPWNVILHNDWENSVTRIVWVLVRVIPGLSVKKATKILWEAHTKGQAVAKTCHKELAELYEERLRAKGLTVSVEPAR